MSNQRTYLSNIVGQVPTSYCSARVSLPNKRRSDRFIGREKPDESRALLVTLSGAVFL
jgi:hypothetical protein